MQRTLPRFFLLFLVSLTLVLFVSCGPAVLEVTPGTTFETPATPILETPTPFLTSCAEDWPCSSNSLTLTAEMGPTLAAMLTGRPVCEWPCSSDSLTLTAAMGLTFAAIPSFTPLPWATIYPSAGDLGWGAVYGKISDGITNLPIDGATVTCEHSTYTPSTYRCYGISPTNADGIYSFSSVFFHDTDRITLIVEAPGYVPLRFEQTFFTRAEFHADLGLFPADDGPPTPTPLLMCTPPACLGGGLTCGDANGCPVGCGMICLPATVTP